MNDLMTVKQAADYAGVATKTIYRWIESGRLPAQKFGDVWTIPKSSLDAIKLEREQEQN